MSIKKLNSALFALSINLVTAAITDPLRFLLKAQSHFHIFYIYLFPLSQNLLSMQGVYLIQPTNSTVAHSPTRPQFKAPFCYLLPSLLWATVALLIVTNQLPLLIAAAITVLLQHYNCSATDIVRCSFSATDS